MILPRSCEPAASRVTPQLRGNPMTRVTKRGRTPFLVDHPQKRGTAPFPHVSGLSRRKALGLLGAGAGFALASALRGEAGLAAAPWQAAATRTLNFPNGAVIRTVLRDVSPDT